MRAGLVVLEDWPPGAGWCAADGEGIYAAQGTQLPWLPVNLWCTRSLIAALPARQMQLFVSALVGEVLRH